MPTNGDRLAIECVCSRTGNSWTAILEDRNGVWIFAHHYRPEEVERSRRESEKKVLQSEIEHLRTGDGKHLPPPPQVELVPATRPIQISTSQLRNYGFKCPYCGQSDTLRCPACHEVSCLGDIDAHNRTICVRCGNELLFGVNSSSNNSAETSGFVLNAKEPTFESRTRAVPTSATVRYLKGS